MKELFSVRVRIADCITVKSARGQINQVLFSGDCDADFFRGEILPGGVDTQFYLAGRPGILSARYTLKGVDAHGTPTLIFIENRGENDENGVCVTHPRIFTDNPALAWLETAALTGRVTGGESGVTIRFYTVE